MSAEAHLSAPRLLDAVAPPERRGIARDGVRMLVTDRAAGTHTHARFYDLASFLRPGDLLVANDSATLPAALISQRKNGETLQLHVATMIDRQLWTAEPRGSVRAGEALRLPGGGSAVPIAPVDAARPRLWYVSFQIPLPMQAYLAQYGEPIRYGYVRERFSLADYQTIFAKHPGSAEMPSAARPFTAHVLTTLRERAIDVVTVTLHCGVASLEAPERPATERYAVSPETAAAVNLAKAGGGRIVAVGTTALRALESSLHGGVVIAHAGWTDLVIDETYKARTADALLTGFHDTGATHQWILRAFLGAGLLDGAYAEAAQHGYFQHEFGDTHFIL